MLLLNLANLHADDGFVADRFAELCSSAAGNFRTGWLSFRFHRRARTQGRRPAKDSTRQTEPIVCTFWRVGEYIISIDNF